ncbi:MAG: RagB/SusD family nutrient uptake outer membrane protein [Gemmatimonadetes bacterium]|nr:RagB/SusD family nutrient uptake outer membrane protein [Gemmatimonadota bacterium]
MIIRIRKALVAAVGLLLVATTACTNTTVQPKSTVTGANVFNDPGAYEAFLAKLYAGLAVSGQQGPSGKPDIQGIDEGFSQYLRLYWEAEELPTDEAVIAWNDVGLPNMNTMTWGADNGFVRAMYYRIYFQVGMVNQFLRETTDDKLDARGVSASLKAQVHQYRAEARFLRALSYWHAIDLFGNVPLVTENDPLGSTPPKQSTRVDLYNYVVSELKDIEGQLPAPGPDTYGRATGPAADMLLAKLYMNAEVYTGTADYADAMNSIQQVINSGFYSLDPSFHHLFQADNNTSPEIIFSIPQDGIHTQTYGGVNFLIHAECGGSMDPSAYGIDGCWWGIRMRSQAYNHFSAGDGRASFFYTSGQTVDVADIPTFTDGIAASKFTNMTSTGQAGSNPGFVDTDFPMFRLGDAYLMYAEAVLRGGGGTRAQALQYVNALRERAFGGTSGDITDTQLTLPFILNERERELLWEAHRRTDLIRFGEFTGGSYIWEWKGGVAAGTATDAHLDLYPIPGSELIANPNLKQNPGY